MNVKHYDDIDYTVPIPESVYDLLTDEAHRMSMHRSGASAFAHEIDRAHFRYVTFGRKPELEIEIVARTQIAEEMM